MINKSNNKFILIGLIDVDFCMHLKIYLYIFMNVVKVTFVYLVKMMMDIMNHP